MRPLHVPVSVRIVLLVLLIIAISAPADAQTAPPTATATKRDLTITFENGWNAGATLVVPDGDGPFPVVVRVHGSGPYSRDASVPAPDGGTPLSANFALLAARWAASCCWA